ncbi:breast cancer anti-estrogen resistance protein 1-like isoform X2 [Mercenaria mercenaria]|uniref:breast cancer anti-estrogen resistance protein 1-like isoform X2 n=1 Tax=Mercenaria mercenaria TaxID=6596 RepID=UPI00234F51CD|nr:breast cancer anti-estrogen resistance protein 1-like isoform X2 [Mercenaria mercenaria]
MVIEQRLLAKALYDNIAESPDELAFRRGDVITVLEQETGGLEGWWLCSLRGKQGIAPGNRLKLITGLVANHVRSHTADFPSLANQKAEQEWNRRSWDGSSNKVVTPNRHGDLFMYEQPRGDQPDYDVPPTRYQGVNGNMYNATGSNHSSREDLLNASASSFEQSFYDTPPQGRSFNRSQDLSMYDTPPSHLHLDPYDIPSGSVRTSLSSKFSDESMSLSSGLSNSKSNPPSMCDSARSSMDISPMDMYDVPPSQREREARDAKAALYPIRSSKDSGLDMYDSPPKVKSPPSMLDDYDVPKLAAINSERDSQFRNLKIPRSEPSSPGDFLEDYDVPKKSPFALSMMGQKSLSRELKSDISQSDIEDYDVPKQSPHPVVGKPPIAAKTKRHKSNSIGSLLDDYDTPQSRVPVNVTKDDLFTAFRTKENFDQGIDDNMNDYDEPDAQTSENVEEKPKLQRQEHAVDDLYDSPKNNAPVKNMTKEFSSLSVNTPKEPLGVYDIPPQVTRDSVISSKSDSSDSNEGNNRLSTCSTDSRGSDIPIYDELPLELDAANDLVIKLQQDVQKAVNRFSTFVHSSWRKKDNLELKLYDIKTACLNVEEKLGEFVEFGQGTLANSAKLSDRKLINKLSKYLIPLQQALQQMRVSIKHLDDVDWRVSRLNASESPKKDDLGIIASLTKDLTSDVRKLASFIQGNSSLLFKRAKDFNRSSRNSDHSMPTTPVGKPPINRKPALPTKTLNIGTPVQARPLPAPPPTERPLPPTPTDKKSHEFGFSGPDIKRLSGDFSNKRNSGEFKHWSGEIQVKRLSVERNTESDRSSYKTEDLIQEYDYVELEEDKTNEKERENSPSVNKLSSDLNDNLKGPEMKVNDSYEKEMEKTLDEIDGVNIYSDDSGGTLKRDTKTKEIENFETVQNESESEHDTGTLKRRPENESMLENTENSTGTLKRQDQLSETKEEENSTVNENKPETADVPEHDNEPTKLQPLDFEDKQVLAFYGEQLDTHSTLLTNSIDAFFACIENSEAPKVFISHSKFVVVSAHKLVYIGDSLHRNIKHSVVRSKIIQCANILCDNLKSTVTATKTAALQYPSVPAVQEMVDRVVAVSHSARNLKLLVAQAAKL